MPLLAHACPSTSRLFFAAFKKDLISRAIIALAINALIHGNVKWLSQRRKDAKYNLETESF
ncbi:MAG: hypothetical protein B7X75_00995 [Sphingobacteriales bacterium 39-40-5]|nr:MAG: hypothetical protein B7Y24_15370 [Sphingobacteriales bacterium 16-39-50]OZA61953.1 MAG: hypothetical protein B7X75_00995 [Sphingobacteriales bacterium 39-40-5]